MTVADWALIISLGSLVVSICAFVWNVWSKFIYPKPKVKTSISLMKVHHQSGRSGPSCIAIHATNFGPAEVTLYAAIAKSSQYKKDGLGMLNPLENFPNNIEHSNGPFSGGLPKKIAVGEQFSVYFPVEKDWFQKEQLTDFGFQDTFGRSHWCPKKQVTELRERVLSKDKDKT